MKTAVSRRGFVGATLASGLGGAVLGFSSPAIAEPNHGDGKVFDTLGSEVARITKQFDTQPGPGPLLALASTFRVFAGVAEVHRVDEQVKQEVQRLVATYGRRMVIDKARSPDVAEHRRHALRDAGIPMSAQPIPATVYEQQLDTMLAAGGVAQEFTASASALEQAYAALQSKKPAPGSGVVRAQTSAYWEWMIRCAYLEDQCDYFSAQAELFCGLAGLAAYLGPALAPICFGLGLSAGGYCYAAHYYDC